MVRVRKELEEEEQDKIRRKGKMKEALTGDDDNGEDDEDGLDYFEIDGFIVDNDEDEDSDEEDPKQMQKKKKRKRKSLANIVLDDDDLELVRENKSKDQEKMRDGKFKRLKKAGVDTELVEHSYDGEGSLSDDIFGDESNDADDDMADFIVDDEVVVRRKGDSLSIAHKQKKFTDLKHLSSFSKEVEHSFGKADPLKEHINIREVQFQTESDDPIEHESFIPTNMHIAGEGNCVDETDIPERMQIIENIVGSVPVDKMSIEEESSWILSQLACNINPLFGEAKSCRLLDTVKREDVIRFLELHHIGKYDIPFIAMYRKEQCVSLLEDPKQDELENSLNDIQGKPMLKFHKILWIIKELDKKWLLLQKRKSMLMRYYKKNFEEQSQMSFLFEESRFHQQVFDSITNMLRKAETEGEIDDIDVKFNLHFASAGGAFDDGYKRPLMKSYYFNCIKAGLWSLASKFGNPEKFGSLVTSEKVGMDYEEDPDESPEEIASIYKCDTFQTSEAVLKGARHMAAVMLSSEIRFRKYVRNIFMDKALVSTSPTLKGVKTIDSCHEFAGVKWLQDKPLSKFEDSQWLFIQKAEEEKLLQVKIKLPDHALNELTKACNDAYLKDSEGTSTRLWNEQRKSILLDTISNLLLPSMEKEARKLLNAKAKNWVLMKYGQQLWNRVSVAPYLNNDNATAFKQRIMACCWGNGKPGTVFVMLDSRGELIDVMHARSLALRSQSMIDQQRRKNDEMRVLKFLTNYHPHVVILGAANASCIRLREDINEIISMMPNDNSQDVSQEIKGPPAVVLGDEGLPRLYEDSDISMSQLPTQQGIVKRAVALGRYLINPLAMVATLSGENKEVMSWKLTPLEKFLTRDDKLEMIEWVMTDITNQVGIDINMAAQHDWLLAPFQFVSGLGPRKASILHKELLRGTDVRNRRDLAKLGLNTNKVFCNAVGFVQVSCADVNFVDSVDNVLDCTRIHPESYNIAEDLARAIHRQYCLENPDADVSQLNAIEYVQNNPKHLESFNLNEYADGFETEKGECKRVTLFDIKMELLHGFKDPRRPYEEPTQDEVFSMITGENGDVLVEGKRVQATVRHVQSQMAFCLLDSGMTGVIFKEDFSDDEPDDISLTDKLHVGLVLTCKIKQIDNNRCRVNLTCKPSELKDNGEQVLHDIDPYYCQGNIILPSQPQATEKMELGNKNFTPRAISHPRFQNITADQAKEFLADKAVGEYIFHPSSRGPCYLALSLKFSCGLYVHKDIMEGGKSHDIKGLLRLGETLKIGEEIFEGIDKVIEHYVNPLVVYLNAMINFRKFKKGSKAEVDELLKLEKEEYPSRIPYGLGISYEHPGTFILSYIRTTNPHHEFVAVHPKGFKFRKQIFNNAEQLVAYFQKHINDNVARGRNCTQSGGWRSNNVDHHQQSIGHDGDNRGVEFGGGRGRGRGRGRGFERGDRGRGRGRGRGFGPRSGPRDDFTGNANDDGNFTSSKWGTSPSTRDDSFAAGKGWGVGGSGDGNCGDINQETSNGFGWGQKSGEDRQQNSLGGGWSNIGTDQNNDGGKGWASGNSSGWKANTGTDQNNDGGKGWASGNSSVWKANTGTDQNNDGSKGWASGNSSGWKANTGTDQNNDGGKGWASGNSSGWKANTGTDQNNDGGKGWASGNSSGWKANTGTDQNNDGGKGWASGNSSGWKANTGTDQNNDGGKGWASGNSSGWKANTGTDQNNDGGKGWASGNSSGWKANTGTDQNNDGGKGWASGSSSGWKDNTGTDHNNDGGKSWGGSGAGEGSGGGGWGQGEGQGRGRGRGRGRRGNHGDSQGRGRGRWNGEENSFGGGGDNNNDSCGGWANGNTNSSDWKDNNGSKSWGGSGPGEGSGGGWGQGEGQGRGRGGRGDSQGRGRGRGRGHWDGNSNESGRHASGGWGENNQEDASDYSGRGQGRGRGRGGGRGWRGSQGDGGRGRGRWGGNSTNEDGGFNGGGNW